MRIVNDEGLNIIKHFEGHSLKVYRCPAGYLTIGYGHLWKTGEPTVITPEIEQQYLDTDLYYMESGVSKLVSNYYTSDNQFSAMVSFTYNLGLTRLKNSTLLRKHKDGDYGCAANEFLKWKFARGKYLPGLLYRRQAESELYST